MYQRPRLLDEQRISQKFAKSLTLLFGVQSLAKHFVEVGIVGKGKLRQYWNTLWLKQAGDES
jgi:hypothetical protein